MVSDIHAKALAEVFTQLEAPPSPHPPHSKPRPLRKITKSPGFSRKFKTTPTGCPCGPLPLGVLESHPRIFGLINLILLIQLDLAYCVGRET